MIKTMKPPHKCFSIALLQQHEASMFWLCNHFYLNYIRHFRNSRHIIKKCDNDFFYKYMLAMVSSRFKLVFFTQNITHVHKYKIINM